jgi:hypothetical protein
MKKEEQKGRQQRRGKGRMNRDQRVDEEEDMKENEVKEWRLGEEQKSLAFCSRNHTKHINALLYATCKHSES